MAKQQKPTHKQVISDRRARAAAMVAQNEQKERRSKIALWGTLGVVMLAVIAMVTVGIVNSNAGKLAISEISPKALSTNGVILTSPTEIVTGEAYNLESGQPAKSEEVMEESKVPNVEIYLDYDCPHCKTFEDAAADSLNEFLEAGAVTVEYKPIVVIGSNLSIAGANAAACVAEYAPTRFNDAHNALFAQQGVQNSTVTKTIRGLGIEGEAGEQIIQCISSKVFSTWVEKATDHALTLKDEKGQQLVTGTPTVVIDGVKYTENPENLPSFLSTKLNKDINDVEESLITPTK